VDGGDWWTIPGGGVDYGESLKDCLLREIKEEIGVLSSSVSSDFKIVHYSIGKVVNGIPRMNVFFRVSVPQDEVVKTDHVEKWGWFTVDEFMKLEMHPSYDKVELAKVIFA
jgi:8-oxo-dGTP pyrophosphatase MutT (NUDIX family)